MEHRVPGRLGAGVHGYVVDQPCIGRWQPVVESHRALGTASGPLGYEAYVRSPRIVAPWTREDRAGWTVLGPLEAAGLGRGRR